MKEKNIPSDINRKSLNELTKEVNSIVAQLEKKGDLINSVDEYQKLMKLNNIIEKKFRKESKKINEITKEKISKIAKKKHEK